MNLKGIALKESIISDFALTEEQHEEFKYIAIEAQNNAPQIEKHLTSKPMIKIGDKVVVLDT